MCARERYENRICTVTSNAVTVTIVVFGWRLNGLLVISL